MSFSPRVTGLLLLAALFLTSTASQIVSSAPPVPAPTLISPTTGTVMDNGCSPKHDGITWDFDWSDVPGATVYNITVWNGSNNPLINNMKVPSSSFHYDSPLPTDHIIDAHLAGWQWRVRAQVNGVWGPWSVTRSFRVERLNTDCP